MPLTTKGQKILEHMEEEYGKKKGEQVFYASANKGSITGVHHSDAEEASLGKSDAGADKAALFREMDVREREYDELMRQYKTNKSRELYDKIQIAGAAYERAIKAVQAHRRSKMDSLAAACDTYDRKDATSKLDAVIDAYDKKHK